MSGPFRFQPDSTRSPLDRQAPQFPAGQPPSFKTNVNRMKTKKWVEAKKNAYDGDDWGDYDEYDEYGVDTPPPQPAPAPVSGSYLDQPSRSFTDPTRQGPLQPARRNSFERGDEHRAFSASTPQQQPYGYGPPQGAGHRQPGARQASAAASDASDTPQNRRDFSPSALPPPLSTRISPAPGSLTSSPVQQFPPRKSSIGQAESPAATSPHDRAPTNPSKSLPFIRPADIYKRVEEERQRERASLDSGRPSLDSLSSRPGEGASSPQGIKKSRSSESLERGNEANRTLQPLETVAERKSEYLPDLNITKPGHLNQERQGASAGFQKPNLPPLQGVTAFDNDFWSSAPPSQLTAGQHSVASPPANPGFRSVVDQAFTRTDESKSIPPTPVSKADDSSVSRSNTNSTAGISPIMSRVPSSATGVLKNRDNAAEGSTPVIAEEPNESDTPVSRPTSTAMLGGPFQLPRKPSPRHSRNASSSSLPQTGLITPSSVDSPARSPVIESQKTLPEPESALLGSLSPASPHTMEGGSSGPSAVYTQREADLASAVRMSPEHAAPELGAAERALQSSFLESHQNAQSPIQDVAPGSRPESPSKGRVHELAGKFGEVSHSRRGSTQSNASRSSIQSWEKSPEHSRPSSPTKSGPSTDNDRPAVAREVSFRPKLPGQWESYATTAPTPSIHSEGNQKGNEVDASTPEANQLLSPLNEVDLIPTTSKHSVSAVEPSKPLSEPLAALKAAGTAMAEAIGSSAAVGALSSDHSQRSEEPTPDRTVGDIYLNKPLQLERVASSVASSIPPTPPAKDTPESEDLPPPPPLKEKSPEPRSLVSQEQAAVRPIMVPQLSTEVSEYDQESDRLRKEIVASLTPQRSAEYPDAEPSRISLQPTVSPTVNRESSILPSEYDSYWAGNNASPRSSQDQVREAVTQSSLLTRFSWEDKTSHSVTPNEQIHAGVSAPPVKGTQEEANATYAPSQPVPDMPRPLSFVSVNATSPEVVEQAPTPPAELDRSESLTKTDDNHEASPSSGLHVVNTELNPEAVDIPPRLSAETSPVSQQPRAGQEQEQPKIEARDTKTPSGTNASVSAPLHDGSPAVRNPESSSPMTQNLEPRPPTTDKPLGFRDIMNIKSTSERVTSYKQTREYWAHADHGLGDWMASTIAANPELVSQPFSQSRPEIGAAGKSHHKPTASLSLFTKLGTNEQSSSTASPAPGTPISSSATPEIRRQGSTSGGFGGRIASSQMQAKGKDLLHSANKLGGKGMTSAKGFFAKGKSRFKSGSGDKVDQ